MSRYLQGVYQSRKNLFVLGGPRTAGVHDEPDYPNSLSSFYAGTVGAANPVVTCDSSYSDE